MMRRLSLAPALIAAAVLAGCGGGQSAGPATGESLISDAGPQHVHGLGVNPADDALYIATHRGLWRASADERKARLVGDVYHDLMGFTIAGPDEFLSSGHPDARHDLPPRMGLQRSSDRGLSWKTVSLLGEADLHVLRSSADRLYGVDSGTGALITSGDGGGSWQQRSAPAAVFDVAIAPGAPGRVVAATEQGLFTSRDTGRTWRPLRDDMAGLLAWPSKEALYLVGGDGMVSRSPDGGRTFERVGEVGGQPEAFMADGSRELYAAIHGGRIVMSDDGGRAWRVRSAP